MRKWDDPQIRKPILDLIVEKYGFKSEEDWYKLTRKMVLDVGGAELIKYYDQSPIKLLRSTFPDYDWKPWLLPNPPRNYWQNLDNLKLYFDWLSEKLGIKTLEDWYKIDYKNLYEFGFGGKAYLYQSLVKIYPDYDWKPWLFKNSPRVWHDPKIRSKFFDWLEKELEIKTSEDWYDIILNDIPCCVRSFTDYHKNIANLVMFYRPDYNWKPWLFRQIPKGYWDLIENRRNAGKWLEERLKIDKAEKWYTITQDDFDYHYLGSFLFEKYSGSPAKFVIENFPEYNLDLTKFGNKTKGQSKLYYLVKEFFPRNMVLWNYKHEKIRSTKNRKLELDIFLPELNLAFELQGMQHFEDNKYFGSSQRLMENDEKKRMECKKLGIQLIEIIYDKSYSKDPRKVLIELLEENNLMEASAYQKLTIPYERLQKLAEKHKPPQSWYEENLEGL